MTNLVWQFASFYFFGFTALAFRFTNTLLAFERIPLSPVNVAIVTSAKINNTIYLLINLFSILIKRKM